jgi:inward rectifier potassium channel
LATVTLTTGLIFARFDKPMARSQVFTVTWMLMHEINESSPLYGLTEQDLSNHQVNILVSVFGHDENVAASVYAMHDYAVNAIVFDGRFVDNETKSAS